MAGEAVIFYLYYIMWRNAWGKILGAFFGFSLAGPVGALFGIIIGNFFDKGLGLAQTSFSP